MTTAIRTRHEQQTGPERPSGNEAPLCEDVVDRDTGHAETRLQIVQAVGACEHEARAAYAGQATAQASNRALCGAVLIPVFERLAATVVDNAHAMLAAQARQLIGREGKLGWEGTPGKEDVMACPGARIGPEGIVALLKNAHEFCGIHASAAFFLRTYAITRVMTSSAAASAKHARRLSLSTRPADATVYTAVPGSMNRAE